MISPELVLVALGSNLGDSQAILQQAAKELEKFSAGDFRISSFFKTDPVDCPPDSPPFINAAACWNALPGETPKSLLQKLKALEQKLGRSPKKVLNEPRPLDLDLIAFGRCEVNTSDLILPHPRAKSRQFVLEPLAEIAPDFPWPGENKTVRQLLAELAD